VLPVSGERRSGVAGVQSSSAGWRELTARLEGQVVVLEPLAPHHEEGLFLAAGHSEIWQWLAPINESREYFSLWFQASLVESEAGREGVFATIDRRSGEPIGSTRYLNVREVHRGVEIGWTWLTPAAWRTGANIEAKLLMLEHAFERLECMRVEFKTDSRNERSRAALAALPAKFEGVFRKHMVMPGVGVRDSAYYSITDEEWPEVRANLERRLAGARQRHERALG
jgi:N-acetyltransferase